MEGTGRLLTEEDIILVAICTLKALGITLYFCTKSHLTWLAYKQNWTIGIEIDIMNVVETIDYSKSSSG